MFDSFSRNRGPRLVGDSNEELTARLEATSRLSKTAI